MKELAIEIIAKCKVELAKSIDEFETDMQKELQIDIGKDTIILELKATHEVTKASFEHEGFESKVIINEIIVNYYENLSENKELSKELNEEIKYML